MGVRLIIYFVLCFAFAHGLEEILKENVTTYLDEYEIINGTTEETSLLTTKVPSLCTSSYCNDRGTCRVVGWLTGWNSITGKRTLKESEFACFCREGFYGKRCEFVFYTTTDRYRTPDDDCDCGVNSKSCKYGWQHDYDYRINTKVCECKQNYAQKDNTCVECDCGENAISCKYGYYGDKFCQCATNYTQNDGTCVECRCGEHSTGCHSSNEGNLLCDCEKGYRQRNYRCAKTCSLSIDCLNGGKCYAWRGYKDDDQFCECPATYTGDVCETDMCARARPKCEESGGWCVQQLDEAECRCPIGKVLHKDRCTVPCNDSNECRHGGKCDSSSGDKYVCTCPEMYRGDLCEIDRCWLIRIGCEYSGGVCKGLEGDKVVCDCPPGKFFSKISGKCEDTCDYNNCEQGTCISMPNGQKKCVCDEGYVGKSCDTSIVSLRVIAAAYIILIVLAVLILCGSVAACLVTRWDKNKKLKKKFKENALKFCKA